MRRNLRIDRAHSAAVGSAPISDDPPRADASVDAQRQHGMA